MIKKLKPHGYWTTETILTELKQIIYTLGHFPTRKELHNLNRYDIMGAIAKSGGDINSFKEKLGFKITKHAKGYWSEERIVAELRQICEKLKYFPTKKEIKLKGTHGLGRGIDRSGGMAKYAKILKYQYKYIHYTGKTHNRRRYRSDENIIEELKLIIEKAGHFPNQTELRDMKESSLEHAIHRSGGHNKFRKILGYPLTQKTIGYWTDEVICKELSSIISQIGHFPTHPELINGGHGSLSTAMRKNNNKTNKFRQLLGFQKYREPTATWTETRIVLELTEIIKKTGYLPSVIEISKMDKTSLLLAIHRSGGMVKFRNLLKQPILHQPEGYWNDATIIQALKQIISKIGHFPSQSEMNEAIGSRLNAAMVKNGGTNKFRELLGFKLSLYEKYRSALASYTNRRGTKSERFVKQIIEEWTAERNILPPQHNVKLSTGNVIEFVCNINKRIGVDVTNTALREAVYRKWKRKDYYKYLDELWIVVFSDSFSVKDYIWWNEVSPSNVKVMTISQFLIELDFNIDEDTKNKISKLETCTFHTKDELVGAKRVSVTTNHTQLPLDYYSLKSN